MDVGKAPAVAIAGVRLALIQRWCVPPEQEIARRGVVEKLERNLDESGHENNVSHEPREFSQTYTVSKPLEESFHARNIYKLAHSLVQLYSGPSARRITCATGHRRDIPTGWLARLRAFFGRDRR